METTNVLSDVLEVFTQVGNWFSTAVGNLTPMFYVAGEGLTFLGVLATAGLAIAVILLVLAYIASYLHFRG